MGSASFGKAFAKGCERRVFFPSLLSEVPHTHTKPFWLGVNCDEDMFWPGSFNELETLLEFRKAEAIQ